MRSTLLFILFVFVAYACAERVRLEIKEKIVPRHAPRERVAERGFVGLSAIASVGGYPTTTPSVGDIIYIYAMPYIGYDDVKGIFNVTCTDPLAEFNPKLNVTSTAWGAFRGYMTIIFHTPGEQQILLDGGYFWTADVMPDTRADKLVLSTNNNTFIAIDVPQSFTIYAYQGDNFAVNYKREIIWITEFWAKLSWGRQTAYGVKTVFNNGVATVGITPMHTGIFKVTACESGNNVTLCSNSFFFNVSTGTPILELAGDSIIQGDTSKLNTIWLTIRNSHYDALDVPENNQIMATCNGEVFFPNVTVYYDIFITDLNFTTPGVKTCKFAIFPLNITGQFTLIANISAGPPASFSVNAWPLQISAGNLVRFNFTDLVDIYGNTKSDLAPYDDKAMYSLRVVDKSTGVLYATVEPQAEITCNLTTAGAVQLAVQVYDKTANKVVVAGDVQEIVTVLAGPASRLAVKFSRRIYVHTKFWVNATLVDGFNNVVNLTADVAFSWTHDGNVVSNPKISVYQGFWSGQAELNAEGEWTLTLDEDHALGLGPVNFTVNVREYDSSDDSSSDSGDSEDSEDSSTNGHSSHATTGSTNNDVTTTGSAHVSPTESPSSTTSASVPTLKPTVKSSSTTGSTSIVPPTNIQSAANAPAVGTATIVAAMIAVMLLI